MSSLSLYAALHFAAVVSVGGTKRVGRLGRAPLYLFSAFTFDLLAPRFN